MNKERCPFFSIIIPIYNSERYLKNCIKSVMNQDFKNFECILIDDGSTDESLNIEKNFKRAFPLEIKIFNQENHGVMNAREKGIDLAKGEYLLFLDADDELEENALSYIYANVNDKEVDLLIYCMTRDKNNLVSSFNYDCLKANKLYFDKSIFYKLILGTDSLNSMCTKCVKSSLMKEHLEELKSRFRAITTSEDLVVSLFLIDVSKSIFFTKEVLYFYRDESNSVTHYFNEKEYENNKYVSCLRMYYAKKWGHGSNDLFLLVNKKNSEAIYVSIMSILNSRLSLREKKSSINKIRKDDFFKKYIVYTPDFNSVIKKTSFIFIKNNIKLGMLLIILIKLILGKTLKVRRNDL